MSREYKISSIRQADDAINNLNDKMRAANRQMANQIANARNEAIREAERRADSMIRRERTNMQNALNREINGVNQNIRELDRAHRQRLQNTANRLENLIDRETDAVRRESRQGIERLGRQLDSLSASTQRQVNALNSRIELVNEASRQRFETVQNRITNLSRDVNRRFDEQQRQLDAHDQRLASHDQQLQSLTKTVNGILDRFSSEDQKRREAVEMAKAIYESAFKRTPIDRFNPEEASRVHDRMARLLRDAGSPAATSQAIEAIMNIQWAEEKALKAKIVYDAVLNQTMEALEAVLLEVNSNREVAVKDPADPSNIVDIEVDFWNKGEFAALQQRLENLRAELLKQPDEERINRIASEIAECEVKAADMIGKASDRAILSENRVIITEDIITALQNQGWQIERAADGSDEVGYEGGEVDNDWREGVYAYLRGMNGERIVIRVTPQEGMQDNEIAFHRVDNRSMTSAEFMRSLQTLKTQIEKSGHKLGAIQAPKGDGGDARLAEITSSSRLGKKGAAQNIRKKMRGQR